MERSKFVNIISNFIYQCGVDDAEADETADELLTLLEKEGLQHFGAAWECEDD